jgi:high-affinity Fe2+/Pb2+ permease
MKSLIKSNLVTSILMLIALILAIGFLVISIIFRIQILFASCALIMVIFMVFMEIWMWRIDKDKENKK